MGISVGCLTRNRWGGGSRKEGPISPSPGTNTPVNVLKPPCSAFQTDSIYNRWAMIVKFCSHTFVYLLFIASLSPPPSTRRLLYSDFRLMFRRKNRRKKNGGLISLRKDVKNTQQQAIFPKIYIFVFPFPMRMVIDFFFVTVLFLQQ